MYAGARLLLRDALVLDEELVGGETLEKRMDGSACVATVIVRGPRFDGLVRYVQGRYEREPRMGARGFGGGAETTGRRWAVLWTAASVRGFLVVKVSGGELQEVRGFLKELLEEEKGGAVCEAEAEADVVREFGEDALRCLR